MLEDGAVTAVDDNGCDGSFCAVSVAVSPWYTGVRSIAAKSLVVLPACLSSSKSASLMFFGGCATILFYVTCIRVKRDHHKLFSVVGHVIYRLNRLCCTVAKSSLSRDRPLREHRTVRGRVVFEILRLSSMHIFSKTVLNFKNGSLFSITTPPSSMFTTISRINLIMSTSHCRIIERARAPLQ